MTLKKERDYKWVILIICFLMEFLCLGFCSSNHGLYTKAVTEALDIKRSLYSISISIRYIVQTIVALSFGTLVNRFGIKKIVFVGLVSLTTSVLCRAFATELLFIYIGGALWGVGMIFVGNTMAGTIARRWFHQDIGKYTGIVMSANGIGGAVAAQIITPIINNGETFGYRKAYLLSAVIAFFISIVVMVFLRESPKSSPVKSYENTKKKPRGTLWSGIDYSVAKKKPYFYFLVLLIFLTGISLQSIGSISVVYLTDLGMSARFLATYATITSLCLTCTKLLVGTSYDMFGLRVTLIMCQVAACGAFILEAVLTNSNVGMVLAIISAVLTTFAIPMETVMIPLLSSDLFGAASYTKVLGVFMAANSLGLCLGSPLGDLYFDIFGTYRPCFWFFTFMMVVVIIGYQFVIRAAYKEKKTVLSEENI